MESGTAFGHQDVLTTTVGHQWNWDVQSMLTEKLPAPMQELAADYDAFWGKTNKVTLQWTLGLGRCQLQADEILLNLPTLDAAILLYLEESTIDVDQLPELCCVSPRAAQNALDRLRAEGLILLEERSIVAAPPSNSPAEVTIHDEFGTEDVLKALDKAIQSFKYDEKRPLADCVADLQSKLASKLRIAANVAESRLIRHRNRAPKKVVLSHEKHLEKYTQDVCTVVVQQMAASVIDTITLVSAPSLDTIDARRFPFCVREQAVRVMDTVVLTLVHAEAFNQTPLFRGVVH